MRCLLEHTCGERHLRPSSASAAENAKGRPSVHVAIGHPMDPVPGEIAHQFSERIRRQVIELHDQTARAYGMPTLDEYGRHRALSQASESGDTASTNHSTCTSKEPAEPPRPNGGQ